MPTPLKPSEAVKFERRFVRIDAVIARIGMKRSWIYSQISMSKFPAPIKLGRAAAWDSEAIDGWLVQQLNTGAAED